MGMLEKIQFISMIQLVWNGVAIVKKMVKVVEFLQLGVRQKNVSTNATVFVQTQYLENLLVYLTLVVKPMFLRALQSAEQPEVNQILVF